jgi:CIC family chloride channel protein
VERTIRAEAAPGGVRGIAVAAVREARTGLRPLGSIDPNGRRTNGPPAVRPFGRPVGACEDIRVSERTGGRIGRFRLHAQIVVAVGVGAATGLVVAVLRTVVFETWEPAVPPRRAWIALLPVAGLVLAVAVLRVGRQSSRDTTEEYVRVFHEPARRIEPRDVPFRLAAALATIGFGVARARGPSIYAGAAIGDWADRRFARLLDETSVERTILIAGAAAGISAIFKAPVTGIVFALEVPYRDDLARHALIPAIFASAASYLVFVALIGTTPLFPIAAAPLSFADLLASLVIGVACGLVARLLIAIVRISSRAVRSMNVWLRAVAAGAVLAVIGLVALELFDRPLPLGPGYVGIGLAASRRLEVGMLVALLVLKLVATPTTTAGGGVGGLFFPAVMMGAAVGGALGHVVPGPPSLFAVVGMAAFLGGAYKVPLAGVAFVAEATGAPGYIIPGLLAAAPRLSPQWLGIAVRAPARAGVTERYRAVIPAIVLGSPSRAPTRSSEPSIATRQPTTAPPSASIA